MNSRQLDGVTLPCLYGAKLGQAPSFVPRANEFRVDLANGTVRSTMGLSVFDNVRVVQNLWRQHFQRVAAGPYREAACAEKGVTVLFFRNMPASKRQCAQ